MMGETKTFTSEESGNESPEDTSRNIKGRYGSYTKFCDVRMIPSKAIYFIRGAARTSAAGFLTPFLTSLGLTVHEAGVISGFQCLSSAVCGPLWGYVADASKKRKLCYVILGLGSLLTLASLPFVGTAMMDASTSNRSFVLNGTYDTSWALLRDKGSISSHSLFYVMLLLIFVSNIFFNPMNGIEDSFVMNLIASIKDRNVKIGDQKSFLSIGMAVAGVVVGYCIDSYHDPLFSKYSAAYYFCTPMLICAIPVGLLVESQGQWDEQKNNSELRVEGRFKLLLSVIGNFSYISILVSALIAGTSNAVRFAFLTQLMKDQMQSSGTSMGLVYVVLGLVEAVLFVVSDRVLGVCGRPVILIECSIMFYTIPNLVVSYLENAWLVMIFETFNAMAFVSFWIGAYAYVQEESHPDIYITLFTILTCLYYDCGGVIADFLGGYIYDTLGGRWLFRGTGCICLVWFLCLVMYHHLIPCIRGFIGGYSKVPGQ